MKKLNLYACMLIALFAFSSVGNAQDATRKAVGLMSQGRLKDAIAALDKAVQKNKDLFAVYKLRATLKRMTGDFAGAVNDYDSAIELKTDDGELYEQRAMTRFFLQQDSNLILKDLDTAIVYGRKSEKIYATRGMIRLQLRDPEGAIADYETAIGLRPDYAGAYINLAGIYSMNRNDDKAIAILERFVAIIEGSGDKIPGFKGEVISATSVSTATVNDDNTAETEGTVTIKTIEGRRTTDSVQTIEDGNKKAEEIEQSKNTAAAYSFLASIYERKQNYKKASELVEKALKIDPTDFPAYETRGKIKSRQGDYQGAISDFDKAIKLLPNIPSMYLERGIAKMLAGNEAEAQKDFDNFIQLSPNEIGKNLLDARIKQARQKPPQ